MEKTIIYIAVIIFLVVYACELATLKIRLEKLTAKAGDILLETTRQKPKKTIAVLIICPLLVALGFLTQSTIFVKILLCLISAVASEIVCRDYVINKIAGIHQNGIASSGQYIAFSKIQKVSPLSTEVENHIINVELKDGTKTQIGYPTSTECDSVLAFLKTKKFF